jgi:uncharacterized protein (TIGR00251 family)
MAPQWYLVGRERAGQVEIQERSGGISFIVRIVARASRDAIEGEFQGALKVRLTAPPVEGRANEALRRLLAERLDAPVSAVRIVAGEKSRTKRVEIVGIGKEQLEARVAEASLG